ncbi:MAG: ATP-binding protein [Armatimonadetes bacterium]|nr:ATP-binding protein [Armatimonadota bacterium]
MNRPVSDRVFIEAIQQAYFRLYSSVMTLDQGGRSLKANLATEEDRQACVLTVLARIGFLMCFQDRGWFSWQGRHDYVAALCDDTRSGLSGYLFTQRLARIFDNATRQPAASARELVRPLVGDVPYLGPSVLGSLNAQLEDTPTTMLPDEVVLEACSPTGVFARYTFTCDGKDGTVGPDRFVWGLQEALGRRTPGAGYDAVYACKEAIQAETGLQDFDGLDSAAATKALQALGRVHVMEEECGLGDTLLAYVETIEETARKLLDQAGEPQECTARTVCQIVGHNMRALDPDPVNAYLARFRLASKLLCLSKDATPCPLPAMDAVIRSGGKVSTAPRQTAPAGVGFVEGPRTEFKSTFEWDSRRQQRNPEHLFASLKTVAAFMNAHGGVLFIGVDDDGQAIGLDGDLDLIDDPHPLDIFEMRFREAMKNHIQPIPLNNVEMQFVGLQGKTVAKIEVAARPGVTYLIRRDPRTGQMLEEVYVRDGNRTLNLSGRTRDQFVLARYGAGNF